VPVAPRLDWRAVRLPQHPVASARPIDQFVHRNDWADRGGIRTVLRVGWVCCITHAAGKPRLGGRPAPRSASFYWPPHPPPNAIDGVGRLHDALQTAGGSGCATCTHAT